MKAVKYLFIVALVAGISTTTFCQQPNTTMAPGTAGTTATQDDTPVDVYVRETIIPTKKPIPYPYIREADVMWAKDIWRIIDLRQRMNYPLRFPEGDPIGKRYSLYQLIMEGLRSEELKPYSFKAGEFNNPFAEMTSLKEVYKDIKADTLFAADGVTPIKINTNGGQVKQFYIKEKWYFDKQHSEMRVRITAIAPVLHAPKYNQFNERIPGVDRIIPFFVSFNDCRNLFAQHMVYNANNDAQNISFDDLFMQRRFASTIAAESNAHGNRMIVDYLSGQDALMEAERVKNDLFIMEHDLWEY